MSRQGCRSSLSVPMGRPAWPARDAELERRFRCLVGRTIAVAMAYRGPARARCGGPGHYVVGENSGEGGNSAVPSRAAGWIFWTFCDFARRTAPSFRRAAEALDPRDE